MRDSPKVSLPALALATAFALTVVLTLSAQAQTFTVLHTFTGGADGANPDAGLTIDKAGNLYGTAAGGGYTGGDCAFSGGCGTVFRLSYKGSGWIFTPLYSFHGGSDGAFPEARVIIGPNGSFYGTTWQGGYRSCYMDLDTCGTVFNLRPSASACKTALCSWTETVLYRFTGGSDGAFPVSDVVFDPAGNMYLSTSNPAVVDKLTVSNGSWEVALSLGFNGGSDGGPPISSLILDSTGNVYGVAAGGGASNYGLVFQLTASGSGWTENVLYTFQGGSDGLYPMAGLIFDQAGNLYGAASSGGSGNGGTVFELTPSNGNWNFSLLYSLSGSGGSRNGPLRSLTMDGAGNLYGTTYSDGAYGAGSVFELTPSNGAWTYTDLYDFTGGDDGANPYGGVTLDANGNLYGTTAFGGASDAGVVWKITP